MTKSKKKVIFFLILAAVLLIAVIVTVSICVSASRPEKMVQSAIPKTLTRAAGWDIPKLMIKTALGGSAELEYSDNDILATATVYPKILKGNTAVSFNLEDAEKAHSGLVFFGEDKLMISSDELPEDTYGFELKDLQKRLDASVWDPDSGKECALTQEEYKKVSDILGLLEPDDESELDYYSLFDKYYHLIFDTVADNAEYSKEKTTTVVFGESVSATRVAFTLDNYAVGKIIDKVWKTARKDAEFKELLDRYVVSVVGENKNIPDYNIDDLMDDINDVAHITMCNFDDEDYFSTTIELYLNRYGVLMRGDVTVEIYGIHGSTYKYTLELGKTLKKFEGVRLSETVIESDGKSRDRVIFGVSVNEDSESEYKLSLLCDGLFSGEFVRNKDEKNYRLDLVTNRGIYIFSGEFVSEKKNFSVSLDSVISPDGTAFEPRMTLSLKTSADMPSFPDKYADLFAVKEHDAVQISKEIKDCSAFWGLMFERIKNQFD